MKTLLWLDDLRNPYLNFEKKVPKKLLDVNIIWVRNYEEFVYFIQYIQIPTYISFDHDLGNDHYTPEKYWEDYDSSKTYQMPQSSEEKTGLDCAKFLINFVMDNKLTEFPEFYVHSANPVGADNIKYLLENYVKFKNKL